jgi:hypothetical protein
MLAIRGLRIQVYGDETELFSLWNGGTIKAITKKEDGGDYFNYSDRLEEPIYPRELSELEYRRLPDEIKQEHATYLLTEFLKRRK